MRGEAVESMTWEDFFMRFRDEFALVIKVQQLAREFQDLCQTIETVAKITTMFWRLLTLHQRIWVPYLGGVF